MFAFLFDEAIVLHLPESDREEVLAARLARPFLTGAERVVRSLGRGAIADRDRSGCRPAGCRPRPTPWRRLPITMVPGPAGLPLKRRHTISAIAAIVSGALPSARLFTST